LNAKIHSFSGFAVTTDGSVQFLRDKVIDNMQSKTCPCCFVGGEKRIKDLVNVLFRDSFSVVRVIQLQMPFLMDCCDPYLAELNAAAPIKDKTRLIVVDGLRALYNGGPRDNPPYRWRQNSIIAGKDTVAVDHLGLEIIEAKRIENGLTPLGDRARHVATAAKLGLGTNDPERIDLREIDITTGA